jgi:hypothetical protein
MVNLTSFLSFTVSLVHEAATKCTIFILLLKHLSILCSLFLLEIGIVSASLARENLVFFCHGPRRRHGQSFLAKVFADHFRPKNAQVGDIYHNDVLSQFLLDLPMGTYRTNKNDQTFRPSAYHVSVHWSAAIVAPSAIFTSRMKHFKPAFFHTLLELPSP